MIDKILLIIKNRADHARIYEALEAEGYVCRQAFSGMEGLICADRDDFDLAILDCGLTGYSWEEVLQRLRAKQEIPVILLSERDDLVPCGVEMIKKPVVLVELLACIAAQLAAMDTEKGLRYKELILNSSTLSVSVRGQEQRLTRLEYHILELLVRNPNRVLSKREIFDHVWKEHYIGEDKTVNVHISNLRRKLRALTDEEYIETVWRVGFRLAR